MNSEAKFLSQLNIDPSRLPVHVAIIMDGNGRWAQKRLLNRVRGHKKGAETVRQITEASREIGIAYLTLYAFSTENWHRPDSEIKSLMELLKEFLASELRTMMDNNIRLNAIGQVERLPNDVKLELRNSLQATASNDGMVLTLALSYGSRLEIIQAIRAIIHKVQSGLIDIDTLADDEMMAVVTNHLYTSNLPDPDLLIRTSGEMRVSNFLLWQIAYAELYITETLWPDFNKLEYFKIIEAYTHRERRFGKV